ncbi:MAG: dicarboxylate/amino acid:cation symporter [Cyanobacteria bacterium J06592_8]
MTTQETSKSLLIPILVGIGVGILIGGVLPAVGESVAFLGELFINGLLMLVIPLVMTSMIVSISSLGDVRRLRGIGGRTLLYYTATTGIAVIVGLILVNIINPGVADTPEARVTLRGGQLLPDTTYTISNNQLALNGESFRRSYDDRYSVILLDQDQIQATVQPEKSTPENVITVSEWMNEAQETITPNSTGTGVQIDLAVATKVQGKESRSIGDVLKEVIVSLLPRNLFRAMADNQVLPLIIFSLVFGGVLTTMGSLGQDVLHLFEGLNEAIMRMVHLILMAAPVGIGALIAGRLGEAGGLAGFAAEFTSLSKYAGAVIIALLIHGAIILPFILYGFGKRYPLPYAKNLASALTTAFSTSSSSATLPVTMECSIERNHISPRIASFVLPLGATINMDGTALYEAVAAVFIAQIYGIELGIGQMIVIFLTATLAAIGAAGIPEAGLVTMVIVLRAVNIPIEGISLILVIDWFLDRCRTTINVWGDAVGAGVIERFEGKKQSQIPEEQIHVPTEAV